MCIIPSRFELDELEAQERKLETKLQTELKTMPAPDRKKIQQQMLQQMQKMSVLRFAGSMLVVSSHA